MSQSNTLPSLVNECTAAETMQLSVKTLRRWRWEGKGPRFIKLGAAVRYDVSDLKDFILHSRKTSTSDLGLPD